MNLKMLYTVTVITLNLIYALKSIFQIFFTGFSDIEKARTHI